MKKEQSAIVHKKERWDVIAIAFITPYLLFLIIFMIYPTFMAVAGSFFKWDVLTNTFTKFYGFKNYTNLFADADFWQSVRNSFVYFVIQIPTSIAGGMLVGNILNKDIRFRTLFRGIYFLPIVTGSIILAIVWKWIFQQSNGVLNYLISLVGMAPVGWLTEKSMAMVSISLMKAWMDVGYYTVIFLAAYQSIPNEFIEAANIDGASSMHIFFKIKLPLLNPTIVFCIMMATIWAFQLFNEPYIMTEGGPLGSSSTMTLFLYRQGFIKHNMSYASAAGVVVAVMIMVISMIERKAFERDVN